MERWYVGNGATREIFRTDTIPTQTQFPQFSYVVGPFRTKRAAKFLAEFGQNNPHVQCVSDAETISKELNYA